MQDVTSCLVKTSAAAGTMSRNCLVSKTSTSRNCLEHEPLLQLAQSVAPLRSLAAVTGTPVLCFFTVAGDSGGNEPERCAGLPATSGRAKSARSVGLPATSGRTKFARLEGPSEKNPTPPHPHWGPGRDGRQENIPWESLRPVGYGGAGSIQDSATSNRGPRAAKRPRVTWYRVRMSLLVPPSSAALRHLGEHQPVPASEKAVDRCQR